MLRSSNNKFDRYIRRVLENAKADPPPFLWHRIEDDLPQNFSWYSRYKYLLLLSILSFSSASSIFVYQNFFHTSNANQAFNKRNISEEKSEVRNDKNTWIATLPGTGNPSSVYPVNNYSEKKSSRPVSYDPTHLMPSLNAEDQEQNNYPQSYQKTSRIQAKTSNEPSQNTAYLTDLFSTKTSTHSNVQQVTTAQTAAPSITALSENRSTDKETAVVNAFLEKRNKSADIIKSNIDQARGFPANIQTASIYPVKVQASPLSSREALYALVNPGRLEELEAKPAAPESSQLIRLKKRIKKNQKEFLGYNINRGFHIGAFFGLNNNWLNQKQYSANENTLDIKPKMHIGKAFGLNMGFDYTDRWGIQLELQLAQQGQNYMISEIDGMHTKKINLLYSKLPLLMKYKHMFNNNYSTKPVSICFLFGPQVSFLAKQRVTQDNQSISAPAYNKMEMGFMGGVDFDMFMTRNTSLTIGARTGFGSTFKKDQPMSLQIGITTQLNFHFPKKIK